MNRDLTIIQIFRNVSFPCNDLSVWIFTVSGERFLMEKEIKNKDLSFVLNERLYEKTFLRKPVCLIWRFRS
jgi:hypothetical protein